ncbi:FHA domain-containing protein [Amycolatopsis alkalitolerans]|uniref:FHA domain-containing protein n=1 Tax=Amycolatopsis alkalitolerans TaxID=2547244 RepID=A0A5C4LT41_9PSEU|nr:FHA domain-containing protein [Amycolatopsis alkalitolerans]TNC20466.1 FHA domain-containing protein [Amycolatopsis alkalitolerans]
MREFPPRPGGARLAPDHDSLAFGVPGAAAGTIFALAIGGGITMGPREGRTLVFGRNRPDVHVCIGEDDRRVSRHQGELTHHADQWWVRSVGRIPLRLPGSRLLFPDDEPVPLATGYTPLFVRGSGRREHLMELFVAGDGDRPPAARHDETTQAPKIWKLSATERLVLVVLAQRYLYHEAHPQPLTWRQAADHLGELRAGESWGPKKVEHLVAAVRARLSRQGVAGLTREEVGEPVGNSLNHNLLRELMETTTLVPPDLRVLDGDE